MTVMRTGRLDTGSLILLAGLAAGFAKVFWVLLPIINPAFVGLMPMGVTLTSKLLFGAAMGGVLASMARA